MKEIAEKLRTFRLANQMTLKELAKKAGCTDAYLSQLERGRANPSIMILKKVASALQVKVVDFFLDEDRNGDDVVLSEKERVNINFRRGDAKIQMLVRDIQTSGCSPSTRRSSLEAGRKVPTFTLVRNSGLYSGVSWRSRYRARLIG